MSERLPNRIVRYSPGDLIFISRHLPVRYLPTKKLAKPSIFPISAATKPERYATPPHMTNVLAEKRVMYVDIPDSHHDEFLPAINISADDLMLRDTHILTPISPKK